MLRHGRNAHIYLQGVDLSGDCNSIKSDSAQDLADVTTFGTSTTGTKAHTFYPGLGKDSGTIEALGNWNTTTGYDRFEALVQAVPASTAGMMICWGNSSGTPAVAAQEVQLSNHNTKTVVTDVNRISYEFSTSNGPFQDCILLEQKKTVTATGDGTSSDNTTSSLLGGAGYAQIFTVGSSGTLTLTMETSSTGAFAGEEATTATFLAASSSEAQRIK